MSDMDIVSFAKNVLGKHVFDYEKKRLRNYEEIMSWSSYDEWVKPPRRENNFLYDIWLSYQEYKQGDLKVI